MEAQVAQEEGLTVKDLLTVDHIEEGEHNKVVGKAIKMLEKAVSKFNSRFEGERTSLRKKVVETTEMMQKNVTDFVTKTNGDLEKFKGRYEAMYTHLVRTFLVKMESRVFSLELFSQATLEQLLKKVYELEGKVAMLEDRLASENIIVTEDGSIQIGENPVGVRSQLEWNQYVKESGKQHEVIMQRYADDFAKQQVAEAKQAAQQGEDSVQLAEKKEEVEHKDSAGGQDEASSPSHSEDSGADSKENVGEA